MLYIVVHSDHKNKTRSCLISQNTIKHTYSRYLSREDIFGNITKPQCMSIKSELNSFDNWDFFESKHPQSHELYSMQTKHKAKPI